MIVVGVIGLKHGADLNTPTHLLMAGALLSRRREPARNWAVVAGALLPDLWIFGMYGWLRGVEGASASEVWRVIYWQEPWQSLGAFFNSIPIWALVLAIGLAMRSTVIAVVGAAALIHLAFDLPLHHGDAHMHFWPLTEWRFRSPLSYWNPAHYGAIIAPLEALLGVALTVILWRRFEAAWLRTLLVIGASGYVLVPAYFTWSIGS